MLDFVEWVAREPRLYSEVIATWRTSCPRLTIWEDAADSGYVTREAIAGVGIVVTVTGTARNCCARMAASADRRGPRNARASSADHIRLRPLATH